RSQFDSFPTRRSSDLDPPRLRGPGGIGFWLVAVFAVVAAAAIALLAAWEEFVGKQGLSTIGSFELGADGQPGFGLLAVFGAVLVALGIIIVLAVASKRRRRSARDGEGQRWTGRRHRPSRSATCGSATRAAPSSPCAESTWASSGETSSPSSAATVRARRRCASPSTGSS